MLATLLGLTLLTADTAAACPATYARQSTPDGGVHLAFTVPTSCACVPGRTSNLRRFSVVLAGPEPALAGPDGWKRTSRKESDAWRVAWSSKSPRESGTTLTFYVSTRSGAVEPRDLLLYRSYSADYGECVVGGVQGGIIH